MDTSPVFEAALRVAVIAVCKESVVVKKRSCLIIAVARRVCCFYYHSSGLFVSHMARGGVMHEEILRCLLMLLVFLM